MLNSSVVSFYNNVGPVYCKGSENKATNDIKNWSRFWPPHC